MSKATIKQKPLRRRGPRPRGLDHTMSFQMRPEQRDALENAAIAQDISVSQLIRTVLGRYLAEIAAK